MDESSALEVKCLFETIGGAFNTEIEMLSEKVKNIKGFLLDWDGVFNNGGDEGLFYEPDSMGLNMLRYGFWMASGGEMPIIAIISTGNNPSLDFVIREHINVLYCGLRDKEKALDHFCVKLHASTINPKHLAFFYDDINDLSAVRRCGVAIQIRRICNPLFSMFTTRKHLCDYTTASFATTGALREASEMLLGLRGIYNRTIESRVNFDDDYKAYLGERSKIQTELYDWDGWRLSRSLIIPGGD